MLEEDYFQTVQIKWETIEAFGFTKQEDGRFLYTELLMDGDFEARISISQTGKFESELFDTAFGDSYLSHLIKTPRGAYVSQVRASYEAILERIRQTCCEEKPFPDEQANRILANIEGTLGDLADFPFKRLPDIRVYRHPLNQKWYALMMVVPWQKLKKQDLLEGKDSEKDVTILNIKVPKQTLPALLERSGFYLSYHMNQTHWVTIALDDTLSDDEVLTLTQQSRQIVGS